MVDADLLTDEQTELPHMVFAKQLAERFDVSGLTILNHARRLVVGTLLPIGPKGTMQFTEAEAAKIGTSIRNTSAGRPRKKPGEPKMVYKKRKKRRAKRQK